MVTIVKHEWHQVDHQSCIELDEDLLSEIYPDLDEDEIANLLKQIEEGEVDVEDVINEAWNNDIDIDWDHQYDDWWTMRKGGYDVTYELGDEDSYHHTPPPDPPYYNCTKCKWVGDRWATNTVHCREDNSIIEDYYSSDEESHHTKESCPMCDSDVKLTEFGESEEKLKLERQAEWDNYTEESSDNDEELDFSDVTDIEPYHAECLSCAWAGPEEDTIMIEGQMCCPDCRETVLTAEQVQEQRTQDLELALQELKDEFNKLMEEEDHEQSK
jgi:uncharacterized Zn finger protein (UPF0148 family)